MHSALKLLVPLFAATLLVTALTQPASASYPPEGKKRVQAVTPMEMKLRQLAADNVRLKKALEAAKERTRKAREDLNELREKLGHLRNAVMLREKLHAEVQNRREKTRHVQEPPVKPEVSEKVSKPSTPVRTESKNAVQVSEKRSGMLERVLGSERVKLLRRLIEGMVHRHYPSQPQSFTPQPKTISAPVEAEETTSPEDEHGLEPLRKRIEAIQSRLKSAKTSKPVQKEVKSPEKGVTRPSAPQVPKKLKNELLEELREGFRRELGKRLKELKHEVKRNRAPVKARPSAWF